VILRDRWVSTTTYATTYGRGSTGIHKDLTTSPQSEKPADKGQTGSNGGPQERGTARYESEGRRFESCRAHYKKPTFAGTLSSVKCRTSDGYHSFTTYGFRSSALQGTDRSDPSLGPWSPGATYEEYGSLRPLMSVRAGCWGKQLKRPQSVLLGAFSLCLLAGSNRLARQEGTPG